MGVHCYLTELGTLVTMAAKIVAVVAAFATVAAGEPGYGYGGVAYHSYGGSSYTHRSPQGLHGGYGYYGYGKRSAEAEPGYGYGHGYGAASVYVSQADHGYGYNPAQYTYGYNIVHGYGKRSADTEPGYGYGKRAAEPGYGHAVSYCHRSPQGVHGHYGGYGYGGYYGKRSAEPGYYGGASSFVHQSRPYY